MGMCVCDAVPIPLTLTIDISDYVTRIGNGARALRKVRTNFNVLSVLRLLRFELGATSRNGFFL